ncbi:Na+/H+ antiporter subunit E [Rickettsiales bacterium LUAb2]
MTKKNILILTILLFILWIIFSGEREYILIGLGFLSIIIVMYLAKKSFVVSELNLLNDIVVHKFFLFIPYLIIEIIKSNLYVVKLIITNKINPQLVVIKNTTKTDVGEYVLSVAITLTPGTLIAEYNKQELLVHVLDNKIKKSLLTMEFNNNLVKLEVQKSNKQ